MEKTPPSPQLPAEQPQEEETPLQQLTEVKNDIGNVLEESSTDSQRFEPLKQGATFWFEYLEYALRELPKLGENDTCRIRLGYATDGDFHALASCENASKITSLNLSDTAVTDKGLEEIAKLTNLKFLYLDGTRLTDKGLEEIAKLTNLRWLSLDRTQVTDDGLKALSQLQNLEDLALNMTQVTDRGLEEIAKLTNLESLDLHGTQVTCEELEKIAKLAHLRRLYLGRTQVTDKGLEEIAKLPRLAGSISVGHR